MTKVLFGPSGNSDSFFEQGFATTFDAVEWTKQQGKGLFEGGLDLYEYSFGHGYQMSGDTAKRIGEKFSDAGIELSVHAPYYINFANPDDAMFDKTVGYIKTGIKFLGYFGANRLVFHPGSCGKEPREVAVERIFQRLKMIMPEIEQLLDEDMFICPETMGKSMQIGTYKEVVDFCTVSKKLMPTFDFGHINALTGGSLKTQEDFQRIFDYCFEKLGEYRTKNAHIHFSKIEYGPKGEIRHLTFDDKTFGPEFEPLCEVLVKNNMLCHVVCESRGTQSEDSVLMKDMYLKMLKKYAD